MIEGTVHRVFRITLKWEEFDKAMKIIREQWLDNQYPENWPSRVASHAPEKISSINLLTSEALHIGKRGQRKERPTINTRDEFRRRELTLRI